MDFDNSNFENSELLPLTQGQLGIWLAQALDRSDPAFNIGECIELCHAVDENAFERAVRSTVQEADALSVRVIETDAGPRQYAGSNDDWIMHHLDFRKEADAHAAAEAWMRADMARPFELSKGPLFRFALLRIEADHYFWYAVNHHIANDGAGWALVVRRVFELYNGFVSGRELLSNKVGPFNDLLEAELIYQGSALRARDHDYWLGVLKDSPAPVTLSTRRLPPGPDVNQITGRIPLSSNLEVLGRKHGAGIPCVLMAATALYLCRMTGQSDLVLGMQVGGRLGPRPRRAVGLATNIIPVRLSIDLDESFDSLLGRTARALREAYRHQLYRAEDLRRDLGLSPSQPNIYSAFVNYTPLDQSVELAGRRIRRRPLGNWRVEDIQLVYYGDDNETGYRFDIVANSVRYSSRELEAHRDRWVMLLNECAVKPETICGRVDIVSATERECVVRQFNSSKRSYDDRLIHEFFEERVKTVPTATALSIGDASLTYEQLNCRANRLAHFLRSRGAGPGTLIPACFERSAEMVIALLGILKCGAAYVPIDPTLPKDRIAAMLADVAPSILLSIQALRAGLPASTAEIVLLDGHADDIARFSGENMNSREVGLNQRSLAYVMYTSGSTGAPKGAMNEHRGVANRLQWMQDEYRLTGDDAVLQKTPFGFDVSVWEFFWPLFAGARLVMAEPLGHLDADYLKRVIRETTVTTIYFVPSMLATFLEGPGLEDCKSLRRVICSGEELSASLAQRCLAALPWVKLYNLYGPTEAAIDVTHWDCSETELAGIVPIGRPIANLQLYILDRFMQPVPLGATGEIYIGGTGVGRGYLNNEQLTGERFVPDPFDHSVSRARLYKTGDLGRWREDGAIEFLGRNDLQVKIRGVRIELPEIELTLARIPGIGQVAVVVREDQTAQPQLIAYYTDVHPEQGPRLQTIRDVLSRTLPQPMHPTAFVRLAAMPLNANGKLDRKSLAAREWPGESRSHESSVPPQGATEQALYDIWREVLRTDLFGRLDDFFDLGGHSLLATQVASRITRVFGVELPLQAVFEARTLAALSLRIDDALQAVERSAIRPQIEPSSEKTDALSYSQRRMWVIQSLDPTNTAYNLSGAIRLLGRLDVRAFSGALDELRQRHENLRTIYFEEDGEVRPQIQPWQPEELVVTDLRSFGIGALTEALQRAQAEARLPIDLARGPVMRATLFRVADNEHLLQLTLHHIAGDQWSVGIIGRELAVAYNALRAGRPVGLEPIALHYRDYAQWQHRHQTEHQTRGQLEYWLKKLNELPALELPIDFPRPKVRGLNGASHVLPIDPSLLSKLDQLSRNEGGTLFMTMLAAFAVQLFRLTGQTDFAIGAPIANRTHSDMENMVGTFVNTLALRVDLGRTPRFLDFLKRVRATALDAYARQDVPFDRLVQEVHQARDNSRAPLVQVMFNMLNAPFYGVTFDELKWEPAIIDRGGAQFELSVSIDAQLSHTVTFEYNTDLFEPDTVKRFAAQYLQILEGIVDDPALSIASISMLPSDEKQLLLREWNAPSASASPSHFLTMFRRQVERQPDATAISFKGQTISYAALDERANTIARSLQNLGIRSGSGVALCMTRSIELIVVLLGIQKAGAHYVPLDPSFPAKRLAYMLDDSGCRVVVSDDRSKERLEAPASVRIVVYEDLVSAGEAADIGADHEPSLSGIAYIIYTSGSTGQPKGVAISNRSLSNFLVSMSHTPGLTRDDVLLAVTTISFDIAGLELYLPLSVGARIELASAEAASDGTALSRLIAESEATVLQATPATWRMLIESGWDGSKGLKALCGGEGLSRDLADALLLRVSELWNLYGPTETTIWSTVMRIQPGEAAISIGRPIDNTRIYIVDREGALAPIGIPGEILIAGEGVAVGYHHRPELTADRFVPDRFANDRNERVYRTGDLGKWSSSGELFHLGRIDSQIKVRGFRIETGEIELTLRKHPAVTEAVVVARELTADDNRLIAYVVCRDEEPTASELRGHLRTYLPDYMIPALIVNVDSVPMTPNGKIDRKALPDPFAVGAHATEERAAPASEAEKLIADIWHDLLKARSIHADDNFFELGGHSLLAVRMVGIIRQRTGLALDPRTLYFKTLRQIAEVVARKTA
ncbi:non-ribosomal peptide synthetase [Bradyrhizobium symbiodeficiens]|uniref:Non-ribosomal peptide synthetase n=1 Tax=Bradyrhizobium symbiodeficiens TaxID=1404367 RepID=A0ABX5VZB9_9BRAD|nr:non-ribosomal peptide synthetase [Bradyrhizobium symbiodeficiens]QDF36235.1 amino acid adenylation domain-containing protein [Bradyrhizobium symbiodeficiens]